MSDDRGRADRAFKAGLPAGDGMLLDELTRCLPADGCIAFLSRQNMAAPFSAEELTELRRFCESSLGGRQAFRDRELEKRRQVLVRRAGVFLKAVDELTVAGCSGRVGVPAEWMEEEPSRFDVAVYRLNRFAERVVRAYVALVGEAGARLAPEGAAESGRT
ncbi:MAG: hypothetical protein ABIG03_02865 [Candidatus Eisenbacteria bacterium]